MNFTDLSTTDIERMMLERAMSRAERLSQTDEKAKWLALAQAMGSPTKTGTFGEGLGNVAGALGTYHTGEQQRRESADDAMQNALAIVYKQKMDLEEKKKKLLERQRKFFQTSEGTFGFANEDEGTVDVRAVGPSQMKIVEKLQERYVNLLSKQGGFTDANELQRAAYQLAMRDYSRMASDTNYVPPEARVYPNPGGAASTGPIPGQPQLDPMAPVADIDMSKFKNLPKALEQPVGGIPDPNSGNVFGRPIGKDPLGDPRYTVKIPGVNDKPAVAPTGNNVPIKTPQQIEQENKYHAADIEESRKQYTEVSKKREEYVPTKDSIGRMEALTLEGSNQGFGAPAFTKLGSFMNYLDPNDRLSKFAQNDEAYTAEMVNLLRGKIQAFGAGTAISNLDLLVSKLASGDISNTRQGRLTLLGAAKSILEHARIEQESKMKWYKDHNGSMIGWEPPTESQAILMPVQTRAKNLKGGYDVVTTYEIRNFNDWSKEALAANPKLAKSKYKDDILKDMWERKAAESRKEWATR